MANARATAFLGAALSCAGAIGASAADLYGGSLKDSPYFAPMEAPRPALYFRLDGGYSGFDEPAISEENIYDLTDENIGNVWSLGGGVGTYLSRSFRADLTVDRRFEGDVEGSLASGPVPGVRHFGLSSTVALANVYYDFDFGNRFTPYLGVGLGFTHNEASSGSVVDDTGAVTASIGEGSSYHVAGAAMAGVSLQLRERLSLDAGYRFLYLGNVSTGAVTELATGTPVAGDPTVEEIHAHEFRFGLRYDIR